MNPNRARSVNVRRDPARNRQPSLWPSRLYASSIDSTQCSSDGNAGPFSVMGRSGNFAARPRRHTLRIAGSSASSFLLPWAAYARMSRRMPSSSRVFAIAYSSTLPAVPHGSLPSFPAPLARLGSAGLGRKTRTETAKNGRWCCCTPSVGATFRAAPSVTPAVTPERPGRGRLPPHQTPPVPSLRVGSRGSDRIRHTLISASRRSRSAS